MDFFWINRDQKSFEWFVKLLSQLEIEQSEQDGVMGHFLDMHMYITSALQRTDMKAVGLQLALDLLHEKVSIWISSKHCCDSSDESFAKKKGEKCDSEFLWFPNMALQS